MSKKNKNMDTPMDEVVSQPKKKKKKSGLAGRIIRRFFLVLFTVVILVVVCLCLVMNMIFNGPSPAARKILTMSLTEASATKWVPGLFMDDEVVESIRQNVDETLPAEFDTDMVVIDRNAMVSANSDEWADHPDGIYIEEIKGDSYIAHIMFIRDPSAVYMATSTDGKFSTSVPGTRITEEIENEKAIAAINAGAFFDNGTSSPMVGSVPEGLVIAGGEVRWNSGKAPEEGFVGFNKDDILVVAKKMTAEEAMAQGIRDGCEFGPVLVMNGEPNQEAYNSDSGWNPRTAIGQRADGTVIFICVDGRQTSSPGCDYKDLIDIMIEYGAVNACNMDGGSSSVMLYRDSQGLYGEAGTVQMINNYSLLQSQPRRMPNFWMVAPMN